MERAQQLAGQTLLVIGGSSGVGFETARLAHDEGAKVIITARDPERVQLAGLELDGSIAAFDATDFHRLGRFFDALRTPIDHVLVTGPGHHSMPLAEFDVDEARRDLEAHLLLPLQVAREAASKVRSRGTLLFTGCTDGRHAIAGLAFISASHGCALRDREEPRIRARTHPRERDRRWVRRYTGVGGRGSAIACVRDASSWRRRCRSDESSARPTSPRSPST